MRFESRITVFSSGEGNGPNSGDFCSLKILTKASGADCVGKVRSLVSRTSPNPSLP